MEKLLLLCLSLGILLSCGQKTPDDAFESLAWLEGSWMDEPTEATTSSEQWHRASPLSLTGFGLTINQSDTLFFETLEIRQENGSIHYVVTGVGENPVYFKLSSRSKDQWIFANPEHDFPKEIIYERVQTDDEEWLIATIRDDERQVPFKFKRVSR